MPQDELQGRYTFRELTNEYDVDPTTRPQQIQLNLADVMLSIAQSDMDEAMQYAALGELASVMAGLDRKWTNGRGGYFTFTSHTVQFKPR